MIKTFSLPVMRVISTVLLPCCLAITAGAEPNNASLERRKVENIRKYRRIAEQKGTASDRRAFASSYITDAAIDEIVDGYPNLESLSASCHGNVTDAGVARASKLKKLKRLYLGGNRITNAGLESLSVLNDVERLKLRGNAISDIGLEHLMTLRKLRYLRIDSTSVTPAGVQRLQAQLPTCSITIVPKPSKTILDDK